MSEPEHAGHIAYSVKELLGNISSKIDLIDSKLDKKAEATTVDQLATRVGLLEAHGSPHLSGVEAQVRQNQGSLGEVMTRLAVLENAGRSSFNMQRLWIPVIFSLVGVLIGVATAVALRLG